MITYRVIGLMSGTSLDGVDIAACEYTLENGKWSYLIHYCQTYPYSIEWKEKLATLQHSNALDFSLVNMEYGHFLGKLTNEFIRATNFHGDFIASHGHTIFHQPERGLTVQIGAGGAIAAETGLPVVCDFRSMDVALNGQGAPLVPIGDHMLFSDFDACLNLGGFANISLVSEGNRIAFDICPVNIVLNTLSGILGLNYDPGGHYARNGSPEAVLLSSLNKLAYYSQSYPKSLGREWAENEFFPLLQNDSIPVNDLLSTVCEHVAIQVNRSLACYDQAKVLFTGGGTHNHYLMEKIREMGNHSWIIPTRELIDFKEALVFGFLGVLRWNGECNILKSVTGSKVNHSGGSIYLI